MEVKIKEIPRRKRYNEGQCSVCTQKKPVKLHHIIPKRYRNDINLPLTEIFWITKGKLKTIRFPVPCDKIMIPVCRECHAKLHPENWKYNMNEMIIDNNLKVKRTIFQKISEVFKICRERKR